MSSELMFGVGIDGTELNTGLSAVDTRIEQSGIRLSEVPRRFAKASAEGFLAAEKAQNEWAQLQIQEAQKQSARLEKSAAESAAVFEAEFAAEAKLAAQRDRDTAAAAAAEQELAQFRKTTAFSRMTDEEKLAVLRHEAGAMLQKIGTLEGEGLEKSQLQLAFEQKKTEIFDLNQKLAGEAAQALAAQTAEAAQQPGLFGKISAVAGDIKERFKEMGVSLKGIGIGIVVAQFISLGKEAIENAQKLRDELANAGKPIDTATNSMASLGDALGKVRDAAVSTVGFVVSGWTQIGELIGSGINRVRGISKAQEDYAAQAQRAADIAVAHVAKLKEQQHNKEAVARAAKELADLEEKSAFDRMSDEEKMQALIAKNLKLREQIKNTEAGTVLEFERKQLLIENENALFALGAKLTKEQADQQQRIDDLLKETFGDLDQIAAKKRAAAEEQSKRDAAEAKEQAARDAAALKSKRDQEKAQAGIANAADQSRIIEENLYQLSKGQLEAEEVILQLAIAEAKARGASTFELEKQLGLVKEILGVATKLKKELPTSISLGQAKLGGGIRTLNDPIEQARYEAKLLANATEQIEQDIRAIEAKIELYRKSGSSFGAYEIPALQTQLAALNQRKKNVSDYVFDPTYSDDRGRGLFGEQVASIGDPLGLQKQNTDTLTSIAKGINDLNDRLRGTFPKTTS